MVAWVDIWVGTALLIIDREKGARNQILSRCKHRYRGGGCYEVLVPGRDGHLFMVACSQMMFFN
jgi:hypothetical protein